MLNISFLLGNKKEALSRGPLHKKGLPGSFDGPNWTNSNLEPGLSSIRPLVPQEYLFSFWLSDKEKKVWGTRA